MYQVPLAGCRLMLLKALFKSIGRTCDLIVSGGTISACADYGAVLKMPKIGNRVWVAYRGI